MSKETALELLQKQISSLDTSGDKESNFESILEILTTIFENAIHKAYPKITNPPVVVTPGTKKDIDYQCNSAMQLVKRLKDEGLPSEGIKPNPSEIAQTIMLAMDKHPIIEKVTVANPGFINVQVNPNFISEKIKSIAAHGINFKKDNKPQKIIVDFSAPNIAKEMHVGHLRSTIIGDCISNIFQFLGHNVIRINHVGDWGTQFGMLLAHLKEKFPNYLNEPLPISDLQSFYKEAKVRFDSDEEFKKRAYSCVVSLQAKDKDMISGWQQICEISRKEFQKIYNLLDIKNLVEVGESFYQEHMIEIVKDLEERNLLQNVIEEDPAKVDNRRVLYDVYMNHLLIVKSDGGFTYDTSDLACLKYRVDVLKADKIVYVTDKGQSEHFKCLFNCADQVKYYDSKKTKVVHVPFGVVVGEDNKKFKTRSGDTVRLIDLLDEGLERALNKLKEKERDKVLTEEELKAAQAAVAFGCIKYADLSKDLTLDYQFNFDRMLDDRGNTAVYLLYSLTRIRSILNNANLKTSIPEIAKDLEQLKLEHPREVRLAKYVLKFADILKQISKDLRPHTMCTYLFELSVTFSEFYEQCYCIEKKPNSDETKINYNRILLCEATAQVIQTGLAILGIKTVSKM